MLVAVVLLGDALVPGQVLLNAGFEDRLPWAHSATEAELALPQWNIDSVRENLNYRIYLHESLSQGDVPWWSPHTFCGLPFVALGHTEVLYPVNWLLLPLGPYSATGWFLVLHMIIAGLGMLAWLRCERLSRPAALLGALVFMCNGMFASRHGHPQFIASGAWLPWILLGSTWLGTARWHRGVVLMGGATAMSVLAGHPSIYVFGYYFVGAWLLAKLFYGDSALSWSQRGRWVGFFGLAFLVGLALSSVQLSGTLELSMFSDRAERTWRNLSSLLPHWLHLLRAVFPSLTGSEALGNYWSVSVTSYMAGALYAGVAPLLLAIVGVVWGGRRGRVAGALCLVLLAVLFAPYVFRLCYLFLPGFRFSRVDRASVTWFLGLSMLAGLGLDVILARARSAREAVAERRAWLEPVIWATAGLLVAGVALVAVHWYASFFEPERLGGWDTGFLLAQVGWGTVLWLAFAGWLAWALRGARMRLLWGSMVVLVLVDLGVHQRSLVTVRDADRVMWSTPSTDFLQAATEPFRIVRYGGYRADDEWMALPANSSFAFGLEDVHGFGPLHMRQLDTLVSASTRKFSRSEWHIKPFRYIGALDSPILDLLGARYVLTDKPLRLTGLRLVHQDDLFIYQRAAVMPRATWVPAHVVVADEDEAARVLNAGEIDPLAAVILHEPPAEVAQTAPGARDRNSVAEVHREPELVRLSKTGPDAGWVRLADPWYPGWRATIDGVEVPIHRSEVMLRAVRVPAGEHEIVFRYRPTWLTLSLWLTGLGLLFCLVLLVLSLRAQELLETDSAS